MSLLRKIQERIRHLLLKPVRVFCFHQVSDSFDPDTMWECDWTQTETFKQKILSFKKDYAFIPLTEAHQHILRDRFRFKNYAALTADDGWESLKSIIPWLAGQGIPITLFLNPLYLDGHHKQIRETEKLLTLNEVKQLVGDFSPFVSVASHGWSHKDCLLMTEEEFIDNVNDAEDVLKTIDGHIPFYAFSFGKYKKTHLEYLKKRELIPVLMNGEKNYRHSPICRECIDSGVI